MKQTIIGNKISELRNQQGLTQKELADLCNIDIRTIQRIESGEVVPRMYTLKLLASALNYDVNLFNINQESSQPNKVWKLSFIAIIIFSVNYIPVVIDLITQSFSRPARVFVFMIHIITCIPFMQAFYFLGKHNKNQLLAISSLLAMILLPLISVMNLFKEYYYSMGYSVFTLVCINAIALGVGLVLEGNKRMIYSRINLYWLAGITTIVQSCLFLSSNTDIVSLGLIISACCNIVMLTILKIEYGIKGLSFKKESTFA